MDAITEAVLKYVLEQAPVVVALALICYWFAKRLDECHAIVSKMWSDMLERTKADAKLAAEQSALLERVKADLDRMERQIDHDRQ